MPRDIDVFRIILGFGGYNIAKPNVHWEPLVDVYELTDKFVILVELPGVKKEDIDITLKDGILRISGVKKEFSYENRVKIYRMEMNYGYFEKIIDVGDVEEKDISAELKDGILTIYINKSF